MPEPYKPSGGSVTYTVPSLDDPADGPKAFRDFADSIPPDLSAAIPVEIKTADYTLALADEGAAVFFDTTAESHKVTVPAHKDAAFPVGTAIVIGNVGTNKEGNVQITPADGVTVRDTAVRKVGLNRMAVILQVEQDSWIINAGTGGGPAPGSVPSPPKLTSAIGGPECAYLNWEAPKDDGGHDLTTYTVEKSTDQVTWSICGQTGPTELSVQITGLKSGEKTYFRVKAANIIGLSDPSNVMDATPKDDYNQASGGEESTYSKDGRTFKVHMFKNSGTLKVAKSAVPFRVLAVAGGGGGWGGGDAYCGRGGGGAGGFIDDFINFTVGDVSVIVGNGGAVNTNGGDSRIGLITAVGGGSGGRGAGNAGGSGGGAGQGGSGGKGTSGQGNSGGPGGDDNYKGGSGGGGAGQPGGAYSNTRGGNGGDGKTSDILNGTPVYYAGGGGGGDSQGAGGGAGGQGGGGHGGTSGGPTAGAPNTGGGGGGQGNSNGGAGPMAAPGGSGIVIVSYEVAPNNDAEGGTVSYCLKNGKTYKVHTMNTDTTFKVKSSVAPWDVLICGAGGTGCDDVGGGGGGGGWYTGTVPAEEMKAGDYPFVIGKAGGNRSAGTATTGAINNRTFSAGGGGGGTTRGGGKSSGGVAATTAILGLTSGNGGQGGEPPGGDGGGGGAGTGGFTSNITGTVLGYCGGGGGGAWNSTASGAGVNGGGNGGGNNGSPGTNGGPGARGGGGGGCSAYAYQGGAGSTGLVIVSYEVSSVPPTEVLLSEAAWKTTLAPKAGES